MRLLNPIRPYVPADLDALLDCWFHTWHATFAPRRHPDPIAAWRQRFADRYAGQSEIWLAGPAHDVQGFIVLFPGWLEQLFVAPNFQRQGLGRALVALARFRCPAGLELDTPAENLATRDFYRRRGFAAQQIGFDPVNRRVIVRYAWPGRDARRDP